MERVNFWPLLRAGKAEQERGLQLAQLAYAEGPYPSQSMELGVALLWLGKYAEAWAHFRSRIDSNSNGGDNDYGMAGTAKWCLGKPDEAVLEWRAGLKAKYARASGLGVVMPMLLFLRRFRNPQLLREILSKSCFLRKLRTFGSTTGPHRSRCWSWAKSRRKNFNFIIEDEAMWTGATAGG